MANNNDDLYSEKEITNQESLNEFGISILTLIGFYIGIPSLLYYLSLDSVEVKTLFLANIGSYMMLQTVVAFIGLNLIFKQRLRYLGYSSWLLLLLPLPFGISALTLLCSLSIKNN